MMRGINEVCDTVVGVGEENAYDPAWGAPRQISAAGKPGGLWELGESSQHGEYPNYGLSSFPFPF